MKTRTERTRSAVLRAATDLMADGGPAALTLDAVVHRSGVAKTTIYRYWKSRDDLLVAVIAEAAPRLPEPDPDADVETALRTAVRALAGRLRDPEWSRLLPAVIMLRRHEADIKAVHEGQVLQNNAILAKVIDRAIDEGLIDRDVDVAEAVTHLLGPLMCAHLVETLPVDDRFADSVVHRFLMAFRPPQKQPAKSSPA